jgi:Redoxin.
MCEPGTKKYKDQGLVVIGVHTPEFAFEKKIENVKRGVTDFDLPYPVAVDNNFKIWRAFSNSYWPAHYFIDANGQIRHHHFGEGEHEESERVIQDLLAEAGKLNTENSVVKLDTRGAEAAPDLGSIQSQETYIGYQRASNFVSPEGVKNDAERTYSAGQPRLNEWSLQGKWTVGAEQATLNQEGGGLTYRFRARDLHLVLGSSTDGKPIRFNIKIDGRVPGESHGADVDAAGNGTVTQTRLYQLVRQAGDVRERTFEIWFLDPGLEAFVFTFG